MSQNLSCMITIDYSHKYMNETIKNAGHTGCFVIQIVTFSQLVLDLEQSQFLTIISLFPLECLNFWCVTVHFCHLLRFLLTSANTETTKMRIFFLDTLMVHMELCQNYQNFQSDNLKMQERPLIILIICQCHCQLM